MRFDISNYENLCVINTKRYCGQIWQILLSSYSDLNMDIFSMMH